MFLFRSLHANATKTFFSLCFTHRRENSIYFRNFHSYRCENTTDLGTDIPSIEFSFLLNVLQENENEFSFSRMKIILHYVHSMLHIDFPLNKLYAATKQTKQKTVSSKYRWSELNAVKMGNALNNWRQTIFVLHNKRAKRKSLSSESCLFINCASCPESIASNLKKHFSCYKWKLMDFLHQSFLVIYFEADFKWSLMRESNTKPVSTAIWKFIGETWFEIAEWLRNAILHATKSLEMLCGTERKGLQFTRTLNNFNFHF